MCIGIIWNNSFLVGGRTQAEAQIDPRPLRTSRSTAHGAQVVWPLDYMGRAWSTISSFYDFCGFWSVAVNTMYKVQFSPLFQTDNTWHQLNVKANSESLNKLPLRDDISISAALRRSRLHWWQHQHNGQCCAMKRQMHITMWKGSWRHKSKTSTPLNKRHISLHSLPLSVSVPT